MTIAGTLKKRLTQDMVLWVNNGSNSYGEYTFATPVDIKVRIEEKATPTMSTNQSQLKSETTVYSQTEIGEGDMLAEGTVDSLSATSTPVDAARQVKRVGKTPDLRVNEILYTAVY